MKQSKPYDKPVMKTTPLTPSMLMVTSIPFNSDNEDASVAVSNGRRGTWGNLWYDGENNENN